MINEDRMLKTLTFVNVHKHIKALFIKITIMKDLIKAIFQLDVPKWIKRVFINYFETNKDNINTINSEIASIKSKNSEQDSSVSSIKSRLDALEAKWLWKKI